MKKLGIVFAGMIIAFGTTTSFAGSKCCPGAKKAAKAAATVETASAKAACAVDCFAGLDLSAEQTEQIKAFKDECAAAGGCTVEAKAKMEAKLAEILTADQMAKFKAACEASGCSSQAKTDDEQSGDQPAS